MKKIDAKIDFVVLWVDPNDKEWQKSRAKYAKEVGNSKYIDNNEERYRDWNLFRYWFRGVEKFAPWVNKVHLVTCGHVPKWLNVNHPKLRIVKHSDFMPKEALPTFNTNAIELCLHRIPDLAEQFVLFNDDVFLTDFVKSTDFFKSGVPINTMSLLAITPSKDRPYSRTLVNNIEIINNHFDFKKFKENNLAKCFSLKQGKYLLTTLPLLLYKDFPGFKNYHIANSYLKSTFDTVWRVEPKILDVTILSKFRDYNVNVSDWLMNYWQFASGNFIQRRHGFGFSILIDNPKVISRIENRKQKILCINDVGIVENFEDMKNNISISFEKILSEKSEFEI